MTLTETDTKTQTAVEPKYFIVSLLCSNRTFGRFLTSGIVVNAQSGKQKVQHSTNRAQARQFSKFVAEDMVVKLRKTYGLTAQVEPALTPAPAPYSR